MFLRTQTSIYAIGEKEAVIPTNDAVKVDNNAVKIEFDAEKFYLFSDMYKAKSKS